MKKIVPFGNRVLVKREKAGEKLGDTIIAPDSVKESLTDIAIVKYVPDNTFIDETLIKDSTEMVASLSRSVKKDGDSESMIALLRFNDYLRVKSIKVGDRVLISKYCGITFNDNFHEGDLTLVDADDVIGVVQ